MDKSEIFRKIPGISGDTFRRFYVIFAARPTPRISLTKHYAL